ADFYSRQNASLPPLITRAALYEQAGLGTAATYTGTVEQNQKLLQSLQAKLGCFVQISTTSPTTPNASAAQSSSTTAPDNTSNLPTAAQLAARLAPVAFTVSYPTEGMFRYVGDYGNTILKRVGTTIYDFTIADPTFVPNIQAQGNAGVQAQFAIAYLNQNYGINWNSLPQYNPGDLQSQYQPALTALGLAPGQRLTFTHLTDFKQFLALGTNNAAGAQTATIN
ncbi:MAG: hypothetical protein KGI70_03595, partial [Patescibacteria group bacterium]|nr:hypothetical protein [Patescibacteria group bacterium]